MSENEQTQSDAVVASTPEEQEDTQSQSSNPMGKRMMTLADKGNYFSGEKKISSGKYVQAISKIDKINYEEGTLITMEALSYTVRHVKTKKPIDILKRVSAYLEPGTLTALMGPSGAGKTTLLDIISGRKTQGTITGDLLFNGVPVTKTFLQQRTSFVEQFDTLVPSLTVYEMILYQAELKCSPSIGLKEKKNRVESLIESLGLTTCRDVKIGDDLNRGISGGQAKRTNIAIGLVTNPDVLFLDEPTTGLDSATSNDVMQTTRAIADSGRTVCATIHSPTNISLRENVLGQLVNGTTLCAGESFRYFHSLILLVKGSLVYFGALYGESGAAIYFEKLGFPYDYDDNLADHLVAITGGGVHGPSSSIDFAQEYADSELVKQNESVLAELKDTFVSAGSDDIKKLLASDRSYAVSPWYTMYALLRYRGVADYSNVGFISARTVDKWFEGFLIATIFPYIGNNCCSQETIQAVSGALFFAATLPAFGASAYVPTIFQERPLYYRERADGCYPVISYLVFKTIEEQILAGITSIIFSIMVFFAVDLVGSFIHFWLTFHVTLSIGILMAYNVAALSPTLDGANSALPAVNVTGLFFVGLLITNDNIPEAWRWFSFLVFNRYSWHGLMQDQFGGNDGAQVGGEPIIDFYDIVLGKWGNFGILTSFLLVYFVTAYLALKYVRYVNR